MKFSWRDRFQREPPSQFVYKKLEANPGYPRFRLLYLIPNPRNPDQLHVRLVHKDFDEFGRVHRYRALSYVWGKRTEAEQPEILISYAFRKPVPMQITPNLYAALAAIRPSNKYKLWVDAICINQADDGQEKAEQVRLMDRIYESAEQVIIWFHPSVNWLDEPLRRPPDEEIYFGPIPDGTEVAIELCRWLWAYLHDENVDFDGFPRLLRRFDTSSNDMLGHPCFTPEQVRRLGYFLKTKKQLYRTLSPQEVADAGLPCYHDRIWTFLDQLFSHAWLTRTWTVQEAILARNATVRSGDCHISWGIFLWIEKQLSFSLGEFPGTKIKAEIEGRAYSETLLMGHFRLITEEEYRNAWFMDLISRLRVNDVAEPVDRVYGILALASYEFKESIRIDYSEEARKQYWRLYLYLAQLAVATGNVFYVLRAAGSGDRLPDLPSWCPNYNAHGLMNSPSWPTGMAGFFDDSTTNIVKHNLDPALGVFRLSLPGRGPRPDLIKQSLDPALIIGGFTVDTVKLVLDDPDRPNFLDSTIGAKLRWLRQIEQVIRDNVMDPDIVPTMFWQCVLGYIPPASDGTRMAHPACSEESFAVLMVCLSRLHGESQDAGATVEPLDEGQHGMFRKVFGLAVDLFKNRRFFLTEKGHFGWGNVGTQAGDNVCVFLGE